MKFAGGVLGWTEDEFWSASFPWFRAAWDGWAIANGVKKAAGPRAPTRDEYEAAKAQLAQHDAQRKTRPVNVQR